MMRRLLLPLLSLALVALPACSVFHPDGSRLRRDLEHHRRAWERLELSSYRYTARMGCFCPPEDLREMVLEVRGDSIVSARLTESGEPLTPSRHGGFEQFYTIDELFGVIEHALSRGHPLEVEYDPELHYPRYLSTYIPRTLDSGFSHTAADLVPVP